MITIYPVNQIPEDVLELNIKSKSWSVKLLYAVVVNKEEDPFLQLLLKREYFSSEEDNGILIFKEVFVDSYIYFVCAKEYVVRNYSKTADEIISYMP